MSPILILASSSPYRRQQLTSLGLQVESVAPKIDESVLSAEHPQILAERLAQAKAQKIAQQYPDAVIIGSDQTACVNVDDKSVILGKPGNIEKATLQLLQCQGKTVTFFSAVCVQHARNAKSIVRTEITEVTFRPLHEADIVAYLESEQPYDCAGSFKAEGKGILLFERLSSRDPNALIGMPLILLREILAEFEIDLLKLSTQAEA
ncbi:Maf family nucleotide pyrophosphatase [Alteromonas ponticola]|uniref:7-methyl-GTP pyrophosphatase n=1 Tax=Alteromonas aquimaris TaxID=2998417 RepID=A0ABT3P7J4_9ALTE|nr:Maf family protein [Alteromonas aquimaris]MCW8108710.1 Maf family nucleotide pyrophosphatase [Alteromonas aquimaris]